MADWKQITARIRRARSGKDPLGQLANLYEKTGDAMVAFELAKLFENSGQNSDAAKWYSTAASRFRRAEWKTKAQEAAVRLGGSSQEAPGEAPAQSDAAFRLVTPETAPEEKGLPFEQNAEALESAVAVSSELQEATQQDASSTSLPERKGRPRGRRGGRNRRRASSATQAAVRPATRIPKAGGRLEPVSAAEQPQASEEASSLRIVHGRLMPTLPVEPLGETGGPSPKGRYGDPGLSSRISLLEMQFRRLLACPPAKVIEADRAPAGPGVFVLTDSDLTTYYYVEACQTLRVAVSNLIRGGSRRGADSIKPQLAEHLGIAEARVAKYLADHCVVRWLQLDEGASNFAHFAIAVLRPILNE
ncbi:MAG TPA: hypothetical protein VNB49_07070 [Candidatus Dormibacteraeota bacterium]|nr:hypothetical protein [Candidatus Dormibacteraeota bacterium]